MARKTILVCDNCGTEVDEGKGAMMRVNYTDARRRSKQADLCDACAGGMPCWLSSAGTKLPTNTFGNVWPVTGSCATVTPLTRAGS